MSPPPENDPDSPPPTLTIDWAKYGAMLDDWDGTDEQKHALIETLWSIIVTFVDLGFETRPTCGEDYGEDEIALPDVVSCDLTQLNIDQDQEPPAPREEAPERTPPCR